MHVWCSQTIAVLETDMVLFMKNMLAGNSKRVRSSSIWLLSCKAISRVSKRLLAKKTCTVKNFYYERNISFEVKMCFDKWDSHMIWLDTFWDRFVVKQVFTTIWINVWTLKKTDMRVILFVAYIEVFIRNQLS